MRGEHITFYAGAKDIKEATTTGNNVMTKPLGGNKVQFYSSAFCSILRRVAEGG